MSSKPNALQYSKIGKTHNPTVGHFGVESTLKRFIDKEDIWKFRRQHIKYFIENCPCCQKMSILKIPIQTHGFTTSTYYRWIVWEKGIPFQDKGYILVVVCTFTRWVELFAIRTPDTETVYQFSKLKPQTWCNSWNDSRLSSKAFRSIRCTASS